MKKTSFFLKQAMITLVFGYILATTMGCRHTANGVGQDVERAGEKIQEKTQ